MAVEAESARRVYTRRRSRTERLRRKCRVRGRDGGKVREAVETKGQRRGTRSVRGTVERIPSIQFGSS